MVCKKSGEMLEKSSSRRGKDITQIMEE